MSARALAVPLIGLLVCASAAAVAVLVLGDGDDEPEAPSAAPTRVTESAPERRRVESPPAVAQTAQAARGEAPVRVTSVRLLVELKQRLGEAETDDERDRQMAIARVVAAEIAAPSKGNPNDAGIEADRVETLKRLEAATTSEEFIAVFQRLVRIEVVKEARRLAGARAQSSPIRGGRAGAKPEPVVVDWRDLSSYRDPDPKVRREAVLRAPKMEWIARDIGAELIAALTVALADEDEGVRLAAVGSLRRIHTAGDAPTETAIPALVRAADDPSEEVRASVHAFLIESEIAPEATREIVLRYAVRGTLAERVTSLRAIAERDIAGEEGIDAVRRSLPDPDPQVRAEAAHVVRTIGADASESLPDVRRLIADADEAVRIEAALTVIALSGVDDASRAVIESALRAKSETVRLRAVTGLVEVPESSFASLLVECVGRYEGPVACRALVAIGAIGLTALSDAFTSEADQKRRAQLVHAIAMFGTAAKSTLESVAQEKHASAARTAARSALARLERESER